MAGQSSETQRDRSLSHSVGHCRLPARDNGSQQSCTQPAGVGAPIVCTTTCNHFHGNPTSHLLITGNQREVRGQ